MKLSKTSVNVLMIFIALAVLIIPASVISYSEYSNVTHILEVQTSYTDGDNVNIGAANSTIMNINFTVQSTIGTESGYDSGFFGEKTTTVTRRYMYYDDMITYIGNYTYSVTPDYTMVNKSVYNRGRMIVIPLDINVSTLADYDFYRITTTYGNVIPVIMTGYISPFAQPQRLTQTEYIFINTLSVKSYMQTHENEPVYLVFGSKSVEMLDENIATFEFNVECFNLTGTDVLTWSNTQIYMMTILGCDILLITGFIFTTNFIDVKIDKSKSPKTNRNKKKWG